MYFRGKVPPEQGGVFLPATSLSGLSQISLSGTTHWGEADNCHLVWETQGGIKMDRQVCDNLDSYFTVKGDTLRSKTSEDTSV